MATIYADAVMVNVDANLVLDVDAILARIMEVVGATNDHQLAVKTGTAQTTISTWRAKKRVPFDLASRITQKYGTSLDHLIFGAVDHISSSREIDYGLIDLVFFEVCYDAAQKIIERQPSVGRLDAAIMIYNIRFKAFIGMQEGKMTREQAVFAFGIFDEIDLYNWDAIADKLAKELADKPGVRLSEASQKAR